MRKRLRNGHGQRPKQRPARQTDFGVNRRGSVMSAERIYLDNNATTRILPEVADVMARTWQAAFANPGSQHSFGQDARRCLDAARETTASVLNCSPGEIVFTSGGTESINTAVGGLVPRGQATIALTAGEHPATLAACRRATQNGGRLVFMPVDGQGRLEEDGLHQLPWEELDLAAVILAHNETGVIQDLTVLSELCRKHQVPLFVDAVQAVGKMPVDFRELGAAAMAFGAHKFHGPRGIGGLVIRAGISVPALLIGGHQEAGRRAGTEPVPLVAGMAESLRLFEERPEERIDAVRAMRDRLEERLKADAGPVRIHGAHASRLPNTLSVAFQGLDGEALLVNLNLEGVACSLGSTCASGSAEPAPTLLAMGVDRADCLSSVRFSLSCQNTMDEVDEAADRICRVVQRMHAVSATV